MNDADSKEQVTPVLTGARRQVQAIRARHEDHAGDPGHACDACRLLGLLDRAYGAMDRVQELVSKSQFDPAAMTGALREGRGF